MTYLQYHLLFIAPLLALLALWTWREVRSGRPLAGAYRPENRWAWTFYWLLPLIAFVYTTPWDNYLVYKQVWNYPPERVLGRVGYVPLEEYAFFVLQTLIAGLWLFLLLRRGGPPHISTFAVRWGGAVLLLLLAFAGAFMLSFESTFYLGLILAWAMPVLALQWAFGGDLVLGNARTFLLAVLPPTVYLWATDLFAIRQGIWSISERYTTGLNLFGLPLEEAVFFLVTNLLVVTGLLLFLHPVALERVRFLRATVRPWVGLLALSALLRVPVPLWPEGFALLATISTLLLALAALAWAWEQVGARALLLAGLAFGVGLLVEVLGSRTGFPFGAYSYDPPGPTLLGVPLLVPLGWWWMTAAALALAGGRPLLVGALLVALDLGLEPLMTRTGFWTWSAGGGLYYGVPWVNFLGWFVVGSALAWVLGRLAPELTRTGGSFAWAYRLEALMLPAGLLLLGMWPAALVTFLVMGGLTWTSSRAAFAR
ncbi:carotenoid biosynthesis protein [Deinococcus peraridilitoris]|uniref:Lycopene cyclase domain protein n=1 Tax=Deinococcus peraridilitoris (strain DSM 19664 / LMG 22246 / CIP 109416 / KR-200) TaxID=937777 RepID=L0A4Y4_DEIPD|nr:carotenoid biosynthesis protein [Deinococcus peraridilitoris]AFZ68070.1 lycopene cyclase domain protein [Deinococcus peraridilitoris DSM 19664]